MDRPLAACFWLSVVLLAGCAHSDLRPGEKEYKAAVVALAKVNALEAANPDMVVSDASTRESFQLADLLVTRQTLREQAQASFALGFPPMQYDYAQVYGRHAVFSTGKEAQAAKAKACEQLGKAAASGLLAAAVGHFVYCSEPGQITGATPLVDAPETARNALAIAITQPDPYSTYYPLKSFPPPACFSSGASDRDALSGAAQLPLLSVEQTRAEGFFQLARHERSSHPLDARQHLAQAGTLGCSSKAFFDLQDQLDTATKTTH